MTKRTKDKLTEALCLAGVTTFFAIMACAILALIGFTIWALFSSMPIPMILILGFFLTALGIFYFKPDIIDVVEGWVHR